MRESSRAGTLLFLAVTTASTPAGGAAPAEAIRYSRDIKPILSNNCYACHGPDEKQRKAGLRLDTAEGALAELKSKGRAIVPRDLTKSNLVQRIIATDEADRMPPVSSGKKLTAEQIELLKRWIEQGAQFDAHWSYIAPKRPIEPSVKNAAWPIGAIDRFVLAELEKQAIAPSPEADRRTLIRRLSFDLTGLPPTPEQVAAFVADPSPDAWEKSVDRLLASPHYGERMAVYWLDLVRYGDSKGYHSDNPISVWPYRDYVIRAFNDNKPFNVFTTEQLAGDLLPQHGDEQLIASGYNRLNLHTEEGGAQPKEYLAKYFGDRVRDASIVWLGASIGCAQCHDHKFDPYTQKDFYSFGAFFADLEEIPVGQQVPRLKLPTGEQTAALQRLDNMIARLKLATDAQSPELDAAQAKWEQEKSVRTDLQWTALKPISQTSALGQTIEAASDGTLLVGGFPRETDRFDIIARTDLVGITAIRLEIEPDDSPKHILGRSQDGNVVLSELRVSAGPIDQPDQIKPVKLQNASADFSQENLPVSAAIDGNINTGWGMLPQVHQRHEAIFETAADVGTQAGTLLVFNLEQRHGKWNTMLKFRISIATAPRPLKVGGPSDEIRGILALPVDQRTPEQKTKLAAYYRTIDPGLKAVRAELTDLQEQRDMLDASVSTMLVSTAVEPRPIRILPRGNWMDDSGPLVTPAVPSCLNPTTAVGERRANRLDLADWLTDPRNPLTTRVFVNRLWKLMFSQGIVRTLDDLGSQGARPTHPELLDWLAVEFMESGWDVKHMVRLMVLSRAYRQSSNARPDLRDSDPGNTLLARQGNFRLDAEFVRDNALAVSGLLVDHIGGPSVKPYQPAGYWSFLNFPVREWQTDHGENQYRRGLYTWVQRTFPHPSLLAFDAPSREECTAERPRSNTPLQALVLLNDPTYVEAARVFAARIICENPDPGKRLRFAFLQALDRDPRPVEEEILTGLFAKHVKQYQADPKAAEQLLAEGDAPPPKGVDRVELAAWTSVARTILNLHETNTRY